MRRAEWPESLRAIMGCLNVNMVRLILCFHALWHELIAFLVCEVGDVVERYLLLSGSVLGGRCSPVRMRQYCHSTGTSRYKVRA